MADRQIAVGDLVIVVRAGPCGCTNAVGRVFRVGEIKFHRGGCNSCGDLRNVVAAYNPSRNKWVDLPRLKRIDPDALKDETPTREEIEA